MKAVRIHKHGGVDCLSVDNIKEPECLDDNIIVQIKATALNHLDIWVRNGLPGINIPLPLIMGSDASGIVVETGKNTNKFKIGDKVVIQPGTFNEDSYNAKINKENFSRNYGILGETENGVQAEYASLKENNLHKMSNDLTFIEASSMQLVFMTAYQMLITRANLLKNDIILIYGATSGVGSAAIQIAKDIGSTVISTVGKEDKKEYAYNLGSDYVLLHNKNITSEVMDVTKNTGVDLVCEHIGEATWNQSMRVLKKGGKIVTCGSTSGPKVNIDLRFLFSKQQTILGSTMSDIPTFLEVMKKINSNTYKPFIDKVFLYDDVAQAHNRMENRNHYGKIVLVPNYD